MAANVIGDAWVAIRPDTSEFESALSSGTAGPIERLAKALGPAGLIVGAAIGGGVAIAGAALDMATKYQKSLSMIQAGAQLTAAQTAAMGDIFLSTAGKSTFSADAIAQAFAPVVAQLDQVNGKTLTATQSLEFMQHAMDLAEATGGDLGATTATLAGIMQAFQLPMESAGMATDVLYNASKITNTPVTDLAGAVEKLHSKLGPIGGSLQSIGTLFVDLAEHGVTGSRALLAVSGAANTLLDPTKSVADEIKRLGLNLYDADGNFVGFGSVIGQLAPKLAGMSEQQRMVAENTLLGKGAFDKFDATIMAGLPGWRAANDATTEGATAQKAAATATDNLGGAWDRLKSGIGDMLTKSGAPLNTFLTGLVNFVSGPVLTALQGFGDWMTTTGVPALQSVATWIGDHVVPALQQFGGWVTGTVVPALQSFAGWLEAHVIPQLTNIVTTVLGAVIPALMQFGGWFNDHVIQPLITFAEVVIPPVLSALQFLADHIGIVMAVLSAFALRWLAIKALGITTTVLEFAAAFVTFAGEQGIGAAIAAIAGLGGKMGLSGALRGAKGAMQDFQAAGIPAMAGVKGAVQGVTAEAETLGSTALTAAESSGTGFMSMLGPIGLAAGAVAGITLLLATLAASPSPQQIHDNFLKDLQTPGTKAYDQLHSDNLRAIQDLEDYANSQGWGDIVKTAETTYGEVLAAHLKSIQDALTQDDLATLKELQNMGALSSAQSQALTDYVNRFQLATGDVIGSSSQVATAFTADQIKQMEAAGLLSASIAQIALDIQGNNQALADSKLPWDTWSKLAGVDISTIQTDLLNAQGVLSSFDSLLTNDKAIAAQFGDLLNSPSVQQGLKDFENAVANLPKTPAIPHAAGGHFTSPHLALIAEGGQGESVVPDSQRAAYIRAWSAMGVGDSRSTPIVINQTFHNNSGSVAEMQTVVSTANRRLLLALRAR